MDYDWIPSAWLQSVIPAGVCSCPECCEAGARHDVQGLGSGCHPCRQLAHQAGNPSRFVS
eukprot:scaffold606720_cov17-Prasinocladus_malaysianus.AAC.1